MNHSVFISASQAKFGIFVLMKYSGFHCLSLLCQANYLFSGIHLSNVRHYIEHNQREITNKQMKYKTMNFFLSGQSSGKSQNNLVLFVYSKNQIVKKIKFIHFSTALTFFVDESKHFEELIRHHFDNHEHRCIEICTFEYDKI